LSWYILCKIPLFIYRHLSCEEDRVDTAVLLVQEGAKLDLKNKEEKTPLDLASPALVRQLKNLAGI